MRLDRDQRQVQYGVSGRLRQSGHGGAERNRQRKAGLRDMGQADDPEAAHLQQTGQVRGRAGHPGLDVHSVVGDEGKAAVE